jgi:hypothetical protein
VSTTTTGAGAALTGATAPVGRRVRAYFAPVNRTGGVATVFDAAQAGGFDLETPPTPWVDLGWVTGFARKCGTKVGALLSGAPAIVQTQVRSEIDATVAVSFESWGKLQLAVASGSEQMNLLVTATGVAANGSGGVAAAPVALPAAAAASGSTPAVPGSTATSLSVGAAAAAGFSVGELVAVDVDYTGQVGFVGSGVSAAYVTSSAAVNGDLNYVRRVSLNVGRVVGISAGVLELGAPLLAGVPAAGMQVSRLVGFCDREGGRFFQEWSGLFVVEGEQGDRVLYHYPRLQAMQGSTEGVTGLVAGTTAAGSSAGTTLERFRLAGEFRALPVEDANDGAMVVCFRSYLPGAMRAV